MMALPVLCADVRLFSGYFLGMCLPVQVWFYQQSWFTDMGTVSFLPWHETVCTLAALAGFAALALLAARHFRRKDLT